MENKNFENQNDFMEKNENKFWKTFGMIACGFVLALLTIIVINI